MVFVCGAIWGKILPGEDFWSVKVADVFGGVSALASAVAAYAAWRAASISKEQSEDSARQNRWQIYVSHYELFNKCLEGAERDFNVHFIRKSELYEVLFPTNRDIFISFTPVNSSQILTWHAEYRLLEASSRKSRIPDEQEICVWLSGCSLLAGQLHFSYVKDTDLQVFIGGCVPTGINLENFENALSVMAEILERLSTFSYVKSSPQYNGMTWQMRNGIRSFINSVECGANVTHSYQSLI
jgi:hypothetical protein